MVNTQLTSSSTGTVSGMHRETSVLRKKSLSSHRPSTKTTTRQRLLSWLSLLSIKESLRGSLWRMGMVDWWILLMAASLTKVWSKSLAIPKKTKYLTSSWHQLQPIKVASCQPTSTFPWTSQLWRKSTFSSWPMPSVTSISTGLVQSKSLLLASMLTRSQNSTWQSVPHRNRSTNSLAATTPLKRNKRLQLSRRLSLLAKKILSTRNSISCEHQSKGISERDVNKLMLQRGSGYLDLYSTLSSYEWLSLDKSKWKTRMCSQVEQLL